VLRSEIFDGICCVIFVFRQKERERLKCRWVDNIKVDLSDIRWCDMDWIDLVQDRDKLRAFLNTAMNPRVP
jgi:hypothetical protein